MNRVVLEIEDDIYRSQGEAVDLSIPLRFDGPQPGFFGADAATARPMHAGEFIGDTRLGGSCNAEHLDLTPHCNGTHTECVGHVTNERIAINSRATKPLYLAQVVSITPSRADSAGEQGWQKPKKSDLLITRSALADATAENRGARFDSLIVRTLPNDENKKQRNWADDSTPYFSVEAMQWIVDNGIRQLLVDMPSVDRLDNAALPAHRIFWGMASGSCTIHDAQRPDATITELIFVPDTVKDGLYLLALQLAPFVSDASPSRPLLYRIEK